MLEVEIEVEEVVGVLSVEVVKEELEVVVGILDIDVDAGVDVDVLVEA